MKEPQTRDEFIRKRMERQRRLRKRRLTVFFIFFIIVLIAVGTVLSLTVFFPIENLSSSGSAVYSSEQIVSASGIEKGDNLFTVDKSKVINRLKSKLPYIESVKFERSLPGTLKLKVTDADEYYCILNEEKYYTVSLSGWVLSESDTANENIYEIRGAKVKCAVGTQLEFADTEDNRLIEIISKSLKENDIKIDYIDITDDINLTVGAEGRFTVNFGTSNNIEEKAKHLAGMIKEIPEKSGGKINLSMWTPSNTSATFTEDKKQK